MRESLSFLTRRESLFFKQHAPGTNKLRRIVPHASAAIPAQSSGTTAKALALTIGAVVLTGVANRVLYKMALAPLGNYVFFLAQFQTFGYVAIYAAVLFLRHRAGLVSSKMLSLPRLMAPTFIAIGFVEALSSLLSFIGAAKLPGVVLPLLSQTVLFWQVLLAYTVMGKQLGVLQLIGVGLVVAGVAVAAWPSATTASPFANIDPLYAAIFLASMIFPAIDTILKERVFRVGREIASKEVDLFIINTAGSALQAAFVFAMLPAITAARGMSFADLPQYLSAGWQCFMGGAPPCGADCSGAPLLPLLYVGMNVLFNVAALQLIRQAGNVVVSLVMSAMVPLTMYTFTIPIPFLDAAPPLGLNFLAGTCILMAGLAAYNAPMWGPSLRAYVAEIRRSSSADWDDGGGDGAMGAAAAAE